MKMQTPATPTDAVPDPADIVIAQAEARQCRRHRWLIAGGIISLLIGYPLSPGPYEMLKRFGLVPRVVDPFIYFVVYGPIHWAISTFPFVGDFYRWYFSLLGIK